MLHINLIVLGKLKEKYWREAEAEYLKRLSSWAKIVIHELKEESFSEKNNPEIIKQKEADKIQSVLNKISDSFIIILDEHGQQFSSVNFANHFNHLQQFHHHLTFIIGGPLGLHESILKKANLKLSLSSLTFTHQMARIFLWEQIYRASAIISGKKYHH